MGLTFIDLFSGAGGMSLGFVRAGFRSILAVEKEFNYARSYAANFGNHVLVGNVASFKLRIKSDVVIGGPPCQGFSNLTGNKPGDKRRALWKDFVRVVKRSRCKVFVIENVPNILKSQELHQLKRAVSKLGFFSVTEVVLVASDFGVAQRRHRAFIIGSKIGRIDLPHSNKHRQTVRQAFAGIFHEPTDDPLPQPASGPQLHIARHPTALSLARYRFVPAGGNRFDLEAGAPGLTPSCWLKKRDGGTDIFGRLEWDEPARCTIRCEFFKPEKGRYLHPEAHRPITHWEAARLQGFPDDFKFYGNKIEIAAQIGNAVPPPLAEAVARAIKKQFRRYRNV